MCRRLRFIENGKYRTTRPFGDGDTFGTRPRNHVIMHALRHAERDRRSHRPRLWRTPALAPFHYRASLNRASKYRASFTGADALNTVSDRSAACTSVFS